MAAALDESGEFFQLFAADGRLHIRHFQIVTEMAVNVLMVVAFGKLAELPVEAMPAEIVPARGTDAIAPPNRGRKRSGG